MNLSYRRCKLDDYDSFYRLKSEPSSIAWAGAVTPPDYEAFKRWYASQLISENREIYIVLYNDEIVAYFYIDKISNDIYSSSASGVLSQYCGKGIGTKCVEWREQIIKARGGRQIFTWISEKNVASWKRFERLGYIKTNEFEFKELPAFNRIDIFYKWIKVL